MLKSATTTVALLVSVVLSMLLLPGCRSAQQNRNNNTTEAIQNEECSSETFYIDTNKANIIVKSTWDNNQEEHYSINELNPDRVICMSSSHVAFLCELGCSKNIVGISGTKYIYNQEVKSAIEEGMIAEVGSESAPDYEKIISLKPTLVIAYGIAGADNSYIANLQNYGIKVLVLGDYLESSPLSRLSYIKLFGAMTGKKEMADSIFTSRSMEYHRTKALISRKLRENEYPETKVLINAPFKNVWYVPGGKNYTSRLILDAGGEILGARSNSANSSTESMERMMMLAREADVWLNPNSVTSMNELISEQPLLRDIPAVKNSRVFNNNLRQGDNGGSDIWESGYTHPELILKDLAVILHPELAEALNFNTLYYHRKVE